MSQKFFAYISRMRYIDRWALMRNSQKENVQEHSHMVAVIAHALALIRREIFNGEIDPGEVAVAALYHDAPEILTGDLPTPIKYYNKSIHGAYKELEKYACDKMVNMLPEEMQKSLAPYLLADEDSVEYSLVKAADKFSAYIKCLEELRSGNNEFAKAKKTLEEDLHARNMPEVEYFFKHFVKSFSLTLDELESL